MSADDVLTAFRRDAPYLFLGAAFAGVGLVSAAFAVPRRQRDPLLICFASFGVSYGLRLWISSPMLAMIAQGATFYARLRGAVIRGVREVNWESDDSGGIVRATQGHTASRFALLKNNALLFAPRIVFRFC